MDLWTDSKFKAFVSYSSRDSAIGATFQRQLEYYKIPRPLRGVRTSFGVVPRRLTPLFRDRSDLEASEDLSRRLEQALRQSAWLIVLCSPRSAASRWVNKEIATFKLMGRASRIIAVLVDGHASEYSAERNPEGAFPPSLVRMVDQDGNLSDALAPEPFAPDLRERASDGSGGDGAQFALLKVVARMTDIGLLELTQRQNEAERAERRLYAALAAGAVSLAAIALVAAWFAIGQRNEALRAGSRIFARAAHEATEGHWPDRGIWLALHGLPRTDNIVSLTKRPMEPSALGRLSGALSHFGNRMKLAVPGNEAATHAIYLPDEKHVLVLLDRSAVLVPVGSDRVESRVLSSLAASPAAIAPDGTAVALSEGSTATVVDMASGEVKATLTGHSTPIWSVAFSADGVLIATGSYDETARVWDAKSGRQLAVLIGHTAPVAQVSFSPDGTRVLTLANDQTARLWSSASGDQLRVFRDKGNVVNAALFSPSGDRIAMTNGSGSVLIWNLGAKAPPTVLNGHEASISAANFSPDGRRLVTASHDGTARIWDIETGNEIFKMTHPRNPALMSVSPGAPFLRSAVFSPDGQRVLTAADGGQIRVWDATSGATVKVFNTEPNRYRVPATTASYSPSGEKVLAISSHVFVLDALAGSEKLTLRGNAGDVTGAAYSPDGRTVVTIHEDWNTIAWDSRTGKKLYSLGRAAGSPFAVVFNSVGDKFLTGSYDHTARYWDARTGKLIAEVVHSESDLTSVAISRNGSLIATAGGNYAKISDAETGGLVAVLRGPEGTRMSSVDFSLDSARVVTSGDDGVVRTWSAPDGRETGLLIGHRGEVLRAQFSPNGRTILSAGSDKTAALWNAQSGERMLTLEGHGASLTDAVFSPDGKLIVTSSIDQTARLWNAKDGTFIAELRGQAGELGHASFSADSTRLITAARYGNGVAHIWDTTTGAPIVSLLGHTRAINAAHFSPDGQSIVTASSDGTARIWGAPRALDQPEALIADACEGLARYGRTFELEEAADLGTQDAVTVPCGRGGDWLQALSTTFRWTGRGPQRRSRPAPLRRSRSRSRRRPLPGPPAARTDDERLMATRCPASCHRTSSNARRRPRP